MTFVLLAGGLVLLIAGGELLVRGAVQLAKRFGVSPLLIGLTLVGFGTSTPELVTSVQASLAGSPGIAVGNIVGSNISNILLILGISALLSPIIVSSRALARDGVIVVVVAAMLWAAGYAWGLDRTMGVAFLVGLALYLAYAWHQERAGGEGHTAAFDKGAATELARAETGLTPPPGTARWREGVLASVVFAVGGLALVVFGGRFLVDGAIDLARMLGMYETVIGLTVVAVGTSMPELVTSVLAALRRQSEVALGNVLGSNIYNVLGIGGVTATLSPTVMPPEIIRFDAPVMVGASILLLVFAATGLRLSRREGAVLLACYVAYVVTIWPK
jgi:cation:H+ antiporter